MTRIDREDPLLGVTGNLQQAAAREYNWSRKIMLLILNDDINANAQLRLAVSESQQYAAKLSRTTRYNLHQLLNESNTR